MSETDLAKGLTTQAEADTGNPEKETPDQNEDTRDTSKEETSKSTLPGGEGDTLEDDKGNDGEDKPALPGGEEEGEEESGEEQESEDDKKGAPEEYGKFDLSAGEAIEYSLSDDQLKAFHEFGKENDLNDQQMQNIVNFDIARQLQVIEANERFIKNQMKEGIDKSRQKYGEKYAEAYKRNKGIYNRIFSEKLINKLNDYGISSDPEFFDMLQGFNQVLSEDSMVKGEKSVPDKKNRSLGRALTLPGETPPPI